MGCPDVFFHTWPDESNKIVSPWVKLNDVVFPSLKEVIYTLNPKDFEISELPSESFNSEKANIQQSTGEFIMYKKMYSLYRADLLRQKYEQSKKFSYDYVICSRFDYLPLGIMLQTTRENRLALPDLRSTPWKNCDYFFCGKSQTVSKISNLFHFLNEYYQFRSNISGEDLLQLHAIKNNILLYDFKTSGYLMRDIDFKNLTYGKIHFLDNPLIWVRVKIKSIIHYSTTIKSRTFSYK